MNIREAALQLDLGQVFSGQACHHWILFNLGCIDIWPMGQWVSCWWIMYCYFKSENSAYLGTLNKLTWFFLTLGLWTTYWRMKPNQIYTFTSRCLITPVYFQCIRKTKRFQHCLEIDWKVNHLALWKLGFIYFLFIYVFDFLPKKWN